METILRIALCNLGQGAHSRSTPHVLFDKERAFSRQTLFDNQYSSYVNFSLVRLL